MAFLLPPWVHQFVEWDICRGTVSRGHAPLRRRGVVAYRVVDDPSSKTRKMTSISSFVCVRLLKVTVKSLIVSFCRPLFSMSYLLGIELERSDYARSQSGCVRPKERVYNTERETTGISVSLAVELFGRLVRARGSWRATC